jgi:AhpD family alkylhydroperoxidase
MPRITRIRGQVFWAFAMNRNVLSAFAGFESIYPHGNLERGILEKVILCISTVNQCQFCVNSHLDITNALGVANAGTTDPNDPEHSPRERLAIEYALALHHNSNQISETLSEKLKTTWSDADLVELTFLIGFINMLNWFNNALEVRYHREFEGIRVT